MQTITGVWAAEPNVLREAVQAADSGSDALVSDPDDGLAATREQKIAVLDINGSINKGAGPLARLLGSAVDPDRLRSQLRAVRKDDQVGALMLNVDSPGGKVTGVRLAAREVRKTADEMPVLAYANGKMTSAAYWIASGADEMYAAPISQVGSLAALAEVRSVADALDEKGIDVQIVRSGNYKAKPHPAEQLTDESVSLIEDRVESIHSKMVEDIAAGRGLSESDADDLADGRVYLPEGAEAEGLIEGTAAPGEVLSKLQSTLSSRTSESTTVAAKMREPKYSKGDKVKWSWQGSTVHGRVADVGEQFTVDGNTITGEEDEPVYKIDEYDDGSFKDGNVAKPESSLSKSDKDMSDDNSDTDASTDLEQKVEALADTVGTLADTVSEMQSEAEATAESKADALLAEYEDRIAPAERDKFRALAEQDPETAEAMLKRMKPVAPSGEDVPADETEPEATYGEMQKFPDDDFVGRNDDGEMIATNEADTKVFADLGLSVEDATDRSA